MSKISPAALGVMARVCDAWLALPPGCPAAEVKAASAAAVVAAIQQAAAAAAAAAGALVEAAAAVEAAALFLRWAQFDDAAASTAARLQARTLANLQQGNQLYMELQETMQTLFGKSFDL